MLVVTGDLSSMLELGLRSTASTGPSPECDSRQRHGVTKLPALHRRKVSMTRNMRSARELWVLPEGQCRAVPAQRRLDHHQDLRS